MESLFPSGPGSSSWHQFRGSRGRETLPGRRDAILELVAKKELASNTDWTAGISFAQPGRRA